MDPTKTDRIIHHRFDEAPSLKMIGQGNHEVCRGLPDAPIPINPAPTP